MTDGKGQEPKQEELSKDDLDKLTGGATPVADVTTIQNDLDSDNEISEMTSQQLG